MATRVIKPPAALAPRNANERLVTLEAGGFSYDLLKELSCFEARVLDALRNFPGTIIIRFFRKDEVICYQDDPGFTAFYILKKDEIQKLSGLGQLPALDSLADWDAAAIASVRRRSYDKKARESEPAYMGEGEIFGEMSCLSRTPRSATVRAERDCYVLELMANVFTQGRLKEKLGNKTLERILELHLRGVELFEKLTDQDYRAIVEKLKERLGLSQKGEKAQADKKAKKYELVSPRKHDEVLFAENDRPDGLYIIRLGMVKVVKDASPLVGMADITDWPRFETALRAGALWEKVADKIDDKQELLYALNDLLKLKNFHELIGFKFDAANPLHVLMQQEAKTLTDGKYYDDILRLRGFNRRMLEVIVGDALRTFGAVPPHTLAIRSSREWVFAADDPAATMAESSLIGEIGLFENVPRSATCVAYCHPEAKFGETDLLFIPKDLVADLFDPEYLAKVIAERKRATTSRLGLSVWQENANTQRFEELGLMQGQKLMLIDLDRCTRCDKCVEACVVSHSPPGIVGSVLEKVLPFDWNPFRNTGPRDGRSRLFLDGPRIQVHEEAGVRNYLVPATCRQCKDPVCLVGCPVGSIHKGQNGQIVIEDWCIGCTKCATNCPYNSIQMHTVGVIARSSVGWRLQQGQGPTIEGATPFRHHRGFAEAHTGDEPIQFSHEFELAHTLRSKSKAFMLHIESSASVLQVKINDEAIELRQLDAKEAKQKGWHWEAMLAPIDEKAAPMVPGEKQSAPQPKLRTGTNRIAIEIALANSKPGEVLLDVGLTGYVPPVVDEAVAGDYLQEWVTQSAVVCDMCSGQVGQQPACVTACPHEAAERKYITYDSFLPIAKR